ncbi:MAG: DUF5131 family protein [Akkermansiaceae bacterium]|nr:DUF5131 family protein [Akkermansiaceae bacterium]
MESSKIQWCHSTITPVMGCDGCELWPTIKQLIMVLIILILSKIKEQRQVVREAVEKEFEGTPHPTAAWHARERIIENLQSQFPHIPLEDWKEWFEKLFKCYAGSQHIVRGAKPADWTEASTKGYAAVFDIPEKFRNRMAVAANWGPPTAMETEGSPWLAYLPRLIFASDMGDALSDSIDFEFLKTEIIDNVSSAKGQRHIWLWLTKRPKRMAEFAAWLNDVHGLSWPPNLVAITSVTNQATRSRIDEIRQVPAAIRGLSVEPLAEGVELDLKGINWVITGGESGKYAREFDLAWARSIQEQCREAGVAFFMKQAGANVVEDGFPITLVDGHGGDSAEWPADLRVREFPQEFHEYSPTVSKNTDTVSSQNNPHK